MSLLALECSIISCNCEFSIAETLRRLRDLDLKLKICNFFPTNLLSQMQGWPPLPQSTNSIVSMAKTIGSPKNSAGSPRFLGAQPNHFPYEGGCNLITHNLENRNINLSKFLVVVLYIRTAPFRFSVFCSCNSLSFAQKQNKPLSLWSKKCQVQVTSMIEWLRSHWRCGWWDMKVYSIPPPGKSNMISWKINHEWRWLFPIEKSGIFQQSSCQWTRRC